MLPLIKNSKTRVEYILICILVFFSGNPIISQTGNEQLLFVLVLLCFLCYIFITKKSSTIIDYLQYIIFYILLFSLQVFFVSNFSISSVMFILIKTFIGCFIFSFIKNDFQFKYFNIIYIISIISLLGFFYNSFIGKIEGMQTTEIANTLIVYTQLFEKNTNLFVGRNAGCFWEPGAFQAYINMALLLILPCKEYIQKNRIKIVVLISALITTFSTTGFVVFAIILAIYLLKYSQIAHLKKIVIFICFSFTFVEIYTTADFMKEKIDVQMSADKREEGRLTDFRRLSDLIYNNLLIGSSYTKLSINSGNGFLAHFFSVGLLGTLYYYIKVFVNIARQTNKFYAMLFISIIILLLIGEGLLSYPFFLAFPFIKLRKKKHTTVVDL